MAIKLNAFPSIKTQWHVLRLQPFTVAGAAQALFDVQMHLFPSFTLVAEKQPWHLSTW
jgi:hypothetical protein